MSESATEHGPTKNHQPDKTGNPKGLMKGNTKWYLIGGLGAVAVLVFIFVRQSNSNSSTTSTGSTATLDPTTTAELQQALQGLNSGAYNTQPAAYTVPPSTSTGTTSTSSTPTSTVPSSGSGSITMSLPNAGGQSWESVIFPNQAAVDAWTQWNQSFVNNNNAQATRGQWNTELTSLGVTGVGGAALTGPNPNSPNPYDRS